MSQQEIEAQGGLPDSGLYSRYLAACESHGTVARNVICAAFDKLLGQEGRSEKRALELIVSRFSDADIEPVMDMLSAVGDSDEVDAVDIVYSNNRLRTVSGEPSLKWELLFQALQAAGSKLRIADLRNNYIRGDALRELFHRGLDCQSMDLSNSRIHKLDMLGHFPNLHSLKLDNCQSVTCLPEGCFCAMPMLAKLSMCGTGVRNLWTTCAALCRLPSLRELRFQKKCRCCPGTSSCAILLACLQNERGSSSKKHLYQGRVQSSQARHWSLPLVRNRDEYDSHGSVPSDLSGSDDDSEQLFTDGESEDNPLSGNSSIESGEDSDVDEAVASESQDMDVVRGDDSHDDLHIGGENEESQRDGGSRDGTPIEDTLSTAPEQPSTPQSDVNASRRHSRGSRRLVLDVVDSDDSNVQHAQRGLPWETLERMRQSHAVREVGVGVQSEGADITMLEALERVVSITGTSARSEGDALLQETNHRSTFRLSDGSAEAVSEKEEESSGEEGEDTGALTISAPSLGWPGPRGGRETPICHEKSYREFMITMLPAVQVLDNVDITENEREEAHRVFEERFEAIANKRRKINNVLQVLKRRETGGCGVKVSKNGGRLGYIDIERSPPAYTRSLSAAKMGTRAWPSTKTICRFKLDGGRRCRPRQFEYHPTEPSYMVFGTLQGEVVVINHESDKVVGYVQSSGAPHSILGLCWLNKDPNKLIAGSDNGCLQLYDVNHMRASMMAASRRSGGSSLSSRYSGHGNWGRQSASVNVTSWNGRSPTIYSYDDFDQLTSVHINSTDDYFLASGYSNNVGLYDLRTGTRLQIFTDLHREHINVVKFANHSPQIFATSSFDKEIKMWDLRQKITQPLYTVKSNKGNVMVCFSRDDHYLLSSAVDNEVRQHLAVDGRLHMKFDILPMGSNQNYTRSYYLNGRDYIISGSCEENVVRVCCAQTGRRLRDLAVEGRGGSYSLYVQSLRGNPFKDFHFCMLVAYNHPHSRSEIVKVNLLGGDVHRDGHGVQAPQIPLTGMGA